MNANLQEKMGKYVILQGKQYYAGFLFGIPDFLLQFIYKIWSKTVKKNTEKM